MKKKWPVSPVISVLLLLAVVMTIYAATFLPSARRQLTALEAEIQLYRSQAQLYEPYLSDTTPLEKELEALQQQINRLNDESYVNEFDVSFAISEAIGQYDVSLVSVSLGTATTYEENRALPVHLTIRGGTENILQFIRHFESNTEGSYVSRGVALDIGPVKTDASLVLYLCVPAV